MLGSTLLFSFVTDRQQKYMLAAMPIVFVPFVLQLQHRRHDLLDHVELLDDRAAGHDQAHHGPPLPAAGPEGRSSGKGGDKGGGSSGKGGEKRRRGGKGGGKPVGEPASAPRPPRGSGRRTSQQPGRRSGQRRGGRKR